MKSPLVSENQIWLRPGGLFVCTRIEQGKKKQAAIIPFSGRNCCLAKEPRYLFYSNEEAMSSDCSRSFKKSARGVHR